MAETTNDAGHSDMDYAEHEATYAFFLTLMKYIMIVAIVIVIFLAWMWG